MPNQFRYPGAKPFKTQESHIFFGRERDVEDLQKRLGLSRLVILYSKSGLGKSSMINAGLVPRLKAAGELMPYLVRFGPFTDKLNGYQSPLETTLDLLDFQSALLDRLRPTGEDSLWYQLKSRQLEHPNAPSPLLIFDQFEELFTYPENEIRRFARELSEALYSRVPQRYRNRRRDGFARDPEFLTRDQMAMLDREIDLHILMAIRSDRHSSLNQLKDFLPAIHNAEFELGALSIPEAEDAILSPAYQQDGFSTPAFDYEDAAVENLLEFLSEGGKEPIESVQLQIICEYLEQEVVGRRGQKLIRAADVEDLDRVLENHYLHKISTLPGEAEQLAARRLIEEGLILEEERRRLTLYEGQIKQDYQISDQLLSRLLETHLVRSEPSPRGGYMYELSHDTLVEPVLRAKRRRLEVEQAAQRQLLQEKREKELAEERRQKRIAILISVLMSILAGLSVVGFFYGQAQLRKAQEQEREANRNLLRFLQADVARLSTENRQLEQDAIVFENSGDEDLAELKWSQIEQNRDQIRTNDSLSSVIRDQLEAMQ